MYPLANPTYTGILETTLARPTAQNDRTQQHRRPQAYMLTRNLPQAMDNILTHRIRAAWETHDMFDPSQHGFRTKHGTDSASLLLVDALEHAKETHSACLVSSWGIRQRQQTRSTNGLDSAGSPPRMGFLSHTARY